MSNAEISTGGLGPSQILDLVGRFASPKTDARTGDAPIERAARDFESVFVYKLMEEMRRTVPESGLLDSGAGQQLQGMFWHYLSQDVAERGGLGLWKDLCRQFGSQGVAAGAAPTVERSL